MTDVEKRELDALREENALLKAANVAKVTKIQVTPKGGVSVYGLGRWPVTLYPSQWKALFNASAAVTEVIVAGIKAGQLSETKPPKAAESASASLLSAKV